MILSPLWAVHRQTNVLFLPRGQTQPLSFKCTLNLTRLIHDSISKGSSFMRLEMKKVRNSRVTLLNLRDQISCCILPDCSLVP